VATAMKSRILVQEFPNLVESLTPYSGNLADSDLTVCGSKLSLRDGFDTNLGVHMTWEDSTLARRSPAEQSRGQKKGSITPCFRMRFPEVHAAATLVPSPSSGLQHLGFVHRAYGEAFHGAGHVFGYFK